MATHPERTPSEPRSPEVAASSTAELMSRERIARRAFELYLERGQAPGREVEDWLRAERELKERADEWLARHLDAGR